MGTVGVLAGGTCKSERPRTSSVCARSEPRAQWTSAVSPLQGLFHEEKSGSVKVSAQDPRQPSTSRSTPPTGPPHRYACDISSARLRNGEVPSHKQILPENIGSGDWREGVLPPGADQPG